MLLIVKARLVLSGLLLASLAASAQTPMVSYNAAYRFLKQASWGPTPESVAHVQEVGFSRYMEEQFALPASTISNVPADANGNHSIAPVQQEFFSNAVNGPDQLRQRVGFALDSIWVVSGIKLTDATQLTPYLRMIEADAFANYRTIMQDVTLSPAMGRYLDMVNNDKANPAKGTAPNENYAREVLQLFTLGLARLNLDGTLQLDASGNPRPTYDQESIEGLARTFTGWTYAPLAGAVAKSHNPANWDAPMVAWEANHDTDAKVLLDGFTAARGQTAATDLDTALDQIFRHSNLAPFIARQLIQHLVTSSPTPFYVERVARAFEGNGSGVRGDMKAVVQALLLDPEARAGDASEPANGSGHLSEPVLYMAALLRALGAKVDPVNGLPAYGSNMGQNVYFSPTVFNYFPPNYQIGGTDLNAPEFAILSPATAITRADFVNAILYHKVTGVTLDLTTWTQLAPTPEKLLDRLQQALLGGQLTTDARDVVRKAVTAQTSNTTKAQAALYLAATSGLYQVQR